MIKIKSPMYYWDNIIFKLKRHFVEVLKSSNSDNSIAWGYALGACIAIFPTPGLSILFAIALIAVFKNLNKAAVFIGLIIWNPIVVIPIHWLSLEIGQWTLQATPLFQFKFEILNQIIESIRRIFIGHLIVSIPVGIGNYYLARYMMKHIRFKRALKKKTTEEES